MNQSFPRHSVIAFLGGLFQTRLYHPALAGTPPEEGNWNHFGGLFPTSLYHGSAELAERPASMQAWIPAFAGMTTGVGMGLSLF